MKRLAALAFVLAVAFGAAPVMADVKAPALTGRVVDDAHVLPPDEIARLDAMLAGHEAKTTNQVVVATVASLDGNDVQTYANEVFRAWKLGQKDKNNGVLFLIAPNEREMRIEVGYGLEGELTDAISSQIIREIVTPKFKAGDLPGGIEAGANAIVTVLGGGALPPPRGGQQQDDGWQGWMFLLIFLGIWIFAFVNRGRRTGIWWGGGGFGGGGFGGGGGGGFGGGGGSSGGGGASGRW
ncbi:MAG: TPM domain-containing protein [Parvibaculum sp.]|uniref:TPM domain-containing protein n=1 Tax=Parvibaculum sp. TaxID=2024848 RepID=UPI0028523862|nr:TPM domain-containing protein [Parvibaculum sp.]MDR3498048.1 TPM domain-containing protein [Parvibaculum sp.]